MSLDCCRVGNGDNDDDAAVLLVFPDRHENFHVADGFTSSGKFSGLFGLFGIRGFALPLA